MWNDVRINFIHTVVWILRITLALLAGLLIQPERIP